MTCERGVRLRGARSLAFVRPLDDACAEARAEHLPRVFDARVVGIGLQCSGQRVQTFGEVPELGVGETEVEEEKRGDAFFRLGFREERTEPGRNT